MASETSTPTSRGTPTRLLVLEGLPASDSERACSERRERSWVEWQGEDVKLLSHRVNNQQDACLNLFHSIRLVGEVCSVPTSSCFYSLLVPRLNHHPVPRSYPDMPLLSGTTGRTTKSILLVGYLISTSGRPPDIPGSIKRGHTPASLTDSTCPRGCCIAMTPLSTILQVFWPKLARARICEVLLYMQFSL